MCWLCVGHQWRDGDGEGRGTKSPKYACMLVMWREGGVGRGG